MIGVGFKFWEGAAKVLFPGTKIVEFCAAIYIGLTPGIIIGFGMNMLARVYAPWYCCGNYWLGGIKAP